MGIQVDNLCTFLPQEKVGQFTQLNPQQLLVETERALHGATGSKLQDMHQKLINLSS